MALAHLLYRVTIQLVDRGENSTRRTYQLRASTSAGALTAAAGLASRLAAITDAFIVGYTVEDVFKEDDLTGFPPDVGEVEEEALLSLNLTTAGKHASETVPAPKIDIFVAASGPNANIVDGGNAALASFVSSFSASGLAFISDGEDATAAPFNKGKRIHRHSTKG